MINRAGHHRPTERDLTRLRDASASIAISLRPGTCPECFKFLVADKCPAGHGFTLTVEDSGGVPRVQWVYWIYR